MSVAAAVEPNGARHYRVTATVSGLDAGYGATLEISVTDLTFANNLGPRCTKVSDTLARCTMAGPGPDSIVFLAQPTPGTDATMTFTVVPDTGTPNSDTTNDSAAVSLPALGPRQARPRG